MLYLHWNWKKPRTIKVQRKSNETFVELFDFAHNNNKNHRLLNDLNYVIIRINGWRL